MTKKAYDKIAEGLREALAITRGELKPARLYVPPELDVKAIRAKTGLSQEVFAYSFGFTVEQIRSWEQKRARPLGGVRAYLMMIESDPKEVMKLLAATRRKAA
jgi:putative transcriptional regulator